MKILFFLILSFCSVCCFSNDAVIRVDANNPVFTVTLPGNVTTGYQWSVTTYDKHLLRMTDSKYVSSSTKRIGAGGLAVFTFQRQAGHSYPKATVITFTYARSWDPSSASIKKVTVYFVKTLPVSTRLNGK